MKLFAALICSSLTAVPAAAQSEFHASGGLSVTQNDVYGPGKAASSLSRGLKYLEVLNLYGSGTKGAWNYAYTVGAKATDDERNDAKHVSLVGLQGRATDKTHTVAVGDVFESFSQYALGTSLKGGSYRFLKEGAKLPVVTAVFGWAYPRWDSAWKDPVTRTLTRRGAGLHARQNIGSDLWTGLSAVSAKDTGRISATDPLYDSKNYTFDLNYAPMPGLTVAGEHSRSYTGLSPSAGTAEASSRGNATRVEIVGDADPSRVSLEGENIEPDFYSVLGAATPDRRKVKTKWRYKYTKQVSFTSGLLWYRNNLYGGRAAGTTRNWKPEVSAAIKRPFASRPGSFADISYKFDRKYGGGASGADHYVNLNYRDRFAGLDSDSNVGYTIYRTRTDVRDAREVNLNTSLSSRHETGELVLKPSANLGTWYSKDELADETDKLYEYSLGLGLEAPEAKLTGDLRAGRNQLRKSAANTDDSGRFFAALGAYWRPKLLAKLNDSTLFLRAGFNDYTFSTNSRNFREKSLTAGLNVSF